MLFETAMGDAYAVAWEFVPAEKAPVHDWSGYQRRPQTGNRLPSPVGAYTDDTLRTIANTHVLLSGRHLEPEAYVEAIKAVFAADRRLGWSTRFQTFLEDQEHRPVQDWKAMLVPGRTNGALMGAAVMGACATVVEAVQAGRTQALVTHNEEAAGYAAAISVACFGLRTGACGRDELLAFVMDKVPEVGGILPAEVDRTDRVDMSAARTAGAIMRVLMGAQSARDIIDATLVLGGDTDSVAATACGIASWRPDLYVPDWPSWMAEDLEGGREGYNSWVPL